eukprot:941652-Alexandrium_andersonii.AAC.1
MRSGSSTGRPTSRAAAACGPTGCGASMRTRAWSWREAGRAVLFFRPGGGSRLSGQGSKTFRVHIGLRALRLDVRQCCALAPRLSLIHI